MKTRIQLNLGIFALILASFVSPAIAQTTAMNFSGDDCNGNPVNLFDDLDAGKAVILFFYMPNCGSCPPKAQVVQQMVNHVNHDYPGSVKAYAFPYQNSTTCSYSQTWVSSNNLDLYIPMDSGAVQLSYYGGFGMPTIVLLGGENHDVLFNTQSFSSNDTTTMRDLILNNVLLAAVEKNTATDLAVEVFPNPSSGLITVQFPALVAGEGKVELIDMDGKVLLQEVLDAEMKSSGKMLIDASSIESGTYILRMHHNGSIRIEKITLVN